MSIYNLVKRYMKKHGYTALLNDECGCRLGDLMPCSGEAVMDCSFGYANDCKTCAKRDECQGECPGDYDFLCRSVNCWEGKKGEGE